MAHLLRLHTPGIVTINIVYHMPDHVNLLQEFLWQEIDVIPDIPKTRSFLQYWQEHIDGKLHSVTVMYAGLIKPRELVELSAQTILLN